jgi:hypothetical protein
VPTKGNKRVLIAKSLDKSAPFLTKTHAKVNHNLRKFLKIIYLRRKSKKISKISWVIYRDKGHFGAKFMYFG